MNEPTSLQDLAEMAVVRHKISGRKLTAKAQEHGFRITYTTFNQIRNRTYKSQPSDDTLRAMAWLAGVHEDVAFTAAGKPKPGPPLADELPPGVDNLSLRSRRAVIEMLRALVAAEQGVDDRDDTAPMNQAGTTAGHFIDQAKIARSWDSGKGSGEVDAYFQAEGVLARKIPGGLDRLMQDPRVQEAIQEQMREEQDPRIGTEDDAISPNDDDHVAPPEGYQYRLAADAASQETAARRRTLDENEGA